MPMGLHSGRSVAKSTPNRSLRLLPASIRLMTCRVPSTGLMGSICRARRRMNALPIKGAADVPRIDGSGFGTDFAQPVEEVAQMDDDARRVVRGASWPAKAGGVDSGFAIECSCVQPLRKILKQMMGIALRGVDLNILKKEPHGSRHLAHPFQTAIVASMQEIINQRFEDARRSQ